ncbi:hypothetical protein HYV11_00595 [Candidatus Dependentiae bacterium]|nr:hypothetical protein [Candidatus Dependentiae bacterium]
MVKKYITILLIVRMVELHTIASESDITFVQSQYKEALKDLISVHQSMNPPLPIQLTDSDLIGATYGKIIKSYVVELNGYANIMMAAYARKMPIYDYLQLLSEKFASYEQQIEALIKLFPSNLQQEALFVFYSQLTNIVVQNCVKIIQDYSYELVVDEQRLQSALLAYNLAWKIQTPTMKLNGFEDVSDFKQKLTAWMVSLYQSALAKEKANLEKTVDRQKIYETITSLYEQVATFFLNNGDTQKAQAEKQLALANQQQAAAAQQAQSYMQEAEKQENLGRTMITIDFLQPDTTKTNVSASLKYLNKAENLYNQALQIYTNQDDGGSVTRCQAAIVRLNADQYVRGIQLLWILFLQSDYVIQNRLKEKSFDVLQQFYKPDQKKLLIANETIVEALSDLLDLFSSVPNDFNTQLAILPLLQSAISSYKSAMLSHLQSHQQDQLANMTLLNDTKEAVETFIEIIKEMISMATVKSSFHLDKIVMQAKKIDTLFARNSLLKTMFFYFPWIEVGMATQQSFVSLVIQYCYRIFMNDDAKNDQTILSKLLSLMHLKNYKRYMTGVQYNDLDTKIVALAEKIDIEKEALETYQEAQKNNSWQNQSKKEEDYQSQADMLWNQTIQLYEVAMQLSISLNVKGLSSLKSLQVTYVTILQNYIQNYVKNAPVVVGYQLHVFIPLYKLYCMSQQQKNRSMLTFVNQMMQQLFVSKSGFFDQIEQQMNSFKKSLQQNTLESVNNVLLTNIISKVYLVYSQQKQAAFLLQNILSLAKTPELFLSIVADDTTITVTMTFDKNDYTAQLINPIAEKMEMLQKIISQKMITAEQLEKKMNFIDAKKAYDQIQKNAEQLLAMVKSSDDEKEYKEQYFLAKTRSMADFFASQIETTGAIVFGSIKNIPKNYFTQRYQVNSFSLALLGNAIPESLQGFLKLTVVPLGKAQADALALFKAYLIYQLLQQQGISFTDCYIDYRLQKKAAVSATFLRNMQQAESDAEAFLQKFLTSTKISVAVTQQAIDFVIEHMPLAAIIPLYPSGPYAAIYYSLAADLFRPGSQLITIGGINYVPGQSQDEYQLMLTNIGYAYLSQAQKKLAEVQALAQELVQQCKKQIAAKVAIDEKSFLMAYNRIKQYFLNAQSLLFAQGGSAYFYFEQAKQDQLAALTKQLFLNSYKTYISLLMPLLIGNPVSDQYNLILSDLNQMYVLWSTQLDPVKDAELIEKNHLAVVYLFQVAGDACMKNSFMQPMFGIKQYYYMQAAANYMAANNQYLSIQETQQADTMQLKALYAYLCASNQKVNLYYFAKNNGLFYIPAQVEGSGVSNVIAPQKISFQNLFEEYQNFQAGGNIDAGKIAAYDVVKKLLLDASMYYQFLSKNYAKRVVAKASNSKKSSSLNPELIHYLKVKNILTAEQDTILFAHKDILPKLFALSDDVYVQFENNFSVLTDWCNSLNEAIAYQYIDDYEGGLDQSESILEQTEDLQTKWQSFFIALQKESSSLQNPSSAYVG